MSKLTIGGAGGAGGGYYSRFLGTLGSVDRYTFLHPGGNDERGDSNPKPVKRKPFAGALHPIRGGDTLLK